MSLICAVLEVIYADRPATVSGGKTTPPAVTASIEAPEGFAVGRKSCAAIRMALMFVYS
jgi:hypothetical protein